MWPPSKGSSGLSHHLSQTLCRQRKEISSRARSLQPYWAPSPGHKGTRSSVSTQPPSFLGRYSSYSGSTWFVERLFFIICLNSDWSQCPRYTDETYALPQSNSRHSTLHFNSLSHSQLHLGFLLLALSSGISFGGIGRPCEVQRTETQTVACRAISYSAIL